MTVRYTSFGGQIVHEDRGGVETSFVPDTLGSVMMCRDANGNTTYEAEYWPYGEVRTETGTNPSPWGFVGTLGYYTDEKSKSIYVRARTLRPDYGRWATVGLRWPAVPFYLYAGGQPEAVRDPSGSGDEMGGGSAGFTCGLKIRKLPWWSCLLRKMAEAFARSEYCRNCRALCEEWCDEQAIPPPDIPGFDYDACVKDCKERDRKCRDPKSRFPPWF